jgi:hypothetical protein
MKSRIALLIGVLCLLAACASAGAAPRDRALGDPNLLSSQELRESDAQTLYDLIQRERPRWLAARLTAGTSDGIAVFVNGSRMGGIDYLRQMAPGGIDSIRYLDTTAARNELPSLSSGMVAGAIMITTRRGS